VTGRIVLVFPKLDVEKDYHYVPFSSLAVAAPLEARGIDYAIFDERLTPVETLLDLLKDARAVGVTVFTGYQTHRGYELLRLIKQAAPDVPTIVGGPHVTALPVQTVASELVDYAIAGYGEAPFFALVWRLLNDQPIDDMPGLARKEKSNGSICFTPAETRFNPAYWHRLPFHRLSIPEYINPTTRRVLYVSSYGCPGRCRFCATTEFRKLASRPVAMVREDLDHLYGLYPFEELNLADATFFAQRGRVLEILDHLASFGQLRWIADARAVEVRHMSDGDLCRLRDCGAELIRLMVGLESGSPRIVEGIMNKGKGFLSAYRGVLGRLASVGIPVTSNLIFGTPGETLADLAATRQFVREMRNIHPGLTLCTTFFRPLPGTELYEDLVKSGFAMPTSFEEWAGYSNQSHFDYRVWMDIPWFEPRLEEEYRRGFDAFIDENRDILA
jgi:radical SAM superfamily enzyme YgiQ (UPF0313 family)